MVRIGRAVARLRLRFRLLSRTAVAAWLDDWAWTEGRWYAASAAAHLAVLLLLLLVPWRAVIGPPSAAPAFVSPPSEALEPLDVAHFHLGDAPLEPSQLNSETLRNLQPSLPLAEYNDASKIFQESGGGTPSAGRRPEPSLAGLGGFHTLAFGRGPRVDGGGGVGRGVGTGIHPGSGGAGFGFGNRGSGHRDGLPNGATRESELAVAAALYWLSRHQEPAGNWSLSHFPHHCKGPACSGAAEFRGDAGATALALLAFLAAGETQKGDGPYRETVHKGLFWLVKKQTSDGDLAAGDQQPMYSHGLATLALCEAFGMTRDPRLANAAQAGVLYIERAQNPNSGGWRYLPLEFGDTSVFGWQVMALKSAQMAGLGVFSQSLDNCQLWLGRVCKGEHGGLFAYQPYREPSCSMTAVGLLCRQYLGAAADAPNMIEGTDYLREHPPINSEASPRNIYYWYYATQVMFNLGGPKWDQWNRVMRPHADRDAVQGRLCGGELGPGAADDGRLGIEGRADFPNDPFGADAGGVLPLLAAVQDGESRRTRCPGPS